MSGEKICKGEKERLMKFASGNILTHWASNEDLAKEPKIFVSGDGCYVTDINGEKYLDTFSSLVVSILGHCNAEITEVAKEQLNTLEYFPNYHDSFALPQIKLAEKLAEIMPGDLEVSFLLTTGSEANETALKMARQYHWQNGQKNRYKVISRKNSYHGTSIAAGAYSGIPGLWECLEPTIPGRLFAPSVRCHDCELELEHPGCGLACLKAVEKIIEWEKPDTISAMIMDPVPGSNSGYPIPPDGYLQGIRELCDKHGIILIFDEVQTGFGKTGRMFACEHWNVVPDIMTISKSLTAGFAPLAVAVTNKKIAGSFQNTPGMELRSGGTFGGHPVSCAVALKVLEIIEREDIPGKARIIQEHLRKRLDELKKYPIVGEAHGLGTLWAIELMADRESKKQLEMDCGTFIRDYFWERKMILRNNRNILVIAPSPIISLEEIDAVVDVLHEAIPAAMKHFAL